MDCPEELCRQELCEEFFQEDYSNSESYLPWRCLPRQIKDCHRVPSDRGAAIMISGCGEGGPTQGGLPYTGTANRRLAVKRITRLCARLRELYNRDKLIGSK